MVDTVFTGCENEKYRWLRLKRIAANRMRLDEILLHVEHRTAYITMVTSSSGKGGAEGGQVSIHRIDRFLALFEAKLRPIDFVGTWGSKTSPKRLLFMEHSWPPQIQYHQYHATL